MSEMIDLQDVAHRIRRLGAQNVYVFGSTLDGSATADSDIDLAVCCKSQASAEIIATTLQDGSWPVASVNREGYGQRKSKVPAVAELPAKSLDVTLFASDGSFSRFRSVLFARGGRLQSLA